VRYTEEDIERMAYEMERSWRRDTADYETWGMTGLKRLLVYRWYDSRVYMSWRCRTLRCLIGPLPRWLKTRRS
jgi:hypothetical protein